MIAWTPTLSVGLKEIDDQHKEWFRRAGAFVDGIDHRTAEETSALLNYLRSYSQMHFAAEESLMRDLKYPGYLGHKAQHERFIRDIEKLSAQHRRADLEPMRVAALLGCWMTDHVSLTDQQLALFVSARPRSA
ncbi:MAG: bacteriohemerythrin [Anaeromyxobacteraceae bacterium]